MMGSDDVMMMMGGFSFDGCMDTSLAIRQWTMQPVLTTCARRAGTNRDGWARYRTVAGSGACKSIIRTRSGRFPGPMDYRPQVRTFRDAAGALAAGWAASRSSG